MNERERQVGNSNSREPIVSHASSHAFDQHAHRLAAVNCPSAPLLLTITIAALRCIALEHPLNPPRLLPPSTLPALPPRGLYFTSKLYSEHPDGSKLNSERWATRWSTGYSDDKSSAAASPCAQPSSSSPSSPSSSLRSSRSSHGSKLQVSLHLHLLRLYQPSHDHPEMRVVVREGWWAGGDQLVALDTGGLLRCYSWVWPSLWTVSIVKGTWTWRIGAKASGTAT